MERTLDFLDKEKAFTGIGNDISGAENSREALHMGGLDWHVGIKQTFFVDEDGNFRPIANTVATVREEDGKPLGIVTNRYHICQNEDAFRFTDELLGSGIRYDKAGSFHGGKKVWISAHVPNEKRILGDPVSENLVFLNSHDGTGGVRVLIAPVRIVCSNAINFFISHALRSWSVTHTGDIKGRMESAKEVLFRSEQYMDALNAACEDLDKVILTDYDVDDLIKKIIPMPKPKNGSELTKKQEDSILERRNSLLSVYEFKDDLTDMKRSAWRFMNAVSDYATHAAPKRETKEYGSNLFEKTISGHPMIDAAFRLVSA